MTGLVVTISLLITSSKRWFNSLLTKDFLSDDGILSRTKERLYRLDIPNTGILSSDANLMNSDLYHLSRSLPCRLKCAGGGVAFWYFLKDGIRFQSAPRNTSSRIAPSGNCMSCLIAVRILVSIVHAVVWDTPINLANAYEDSPLVVSTKKYIAYSHLLKGNLVLWKIVFEVSVKRYLQSAQIWCWFAAGLYICIEPQTGQAMHPPHLKR